MIFVGPKAGSTRTIHKELDGTIFHSVIEEIRKLHIILRLHPTVIRFTCTEIVERSVVSIAFPCCCIRSRKELRRFFHPRLRIRSELNDITDRIGLSILCRGSQRERAGAEQQQDR